jgi:hypothetical protein
MINEKRKLKLYAQMRHKALEIYYITTSEFIMIQGTKNWERTALHDTGETFFLSW